MADIIVGVLVLIFIVGTIGGIFQTDWWEGYRAGKRQRKWSKGYDVGKKGCLFMLFLPLGVLIVALWAAMHWIH